MGAIAADLDNDGDFELYMSDLPFDLDPNCNPLDVNNGDGTFTDDQAVAAGVVADRSWAVIFLDCDHDGFQDLFVGTTGDADSDHFLYMNNGDLTFRDESATSGVSVPGDTKGGAATDYDHDLDLAWVDQTNGPLDRGGLRLLRNDTPKSGQWLMVRLVATASNRSAIGARVSGAHGHLDLHFGLASATVVDELTVEWPSGAVNTWRDLAVDQLHVLTEQIDDHVALAADPSDVAGGETLTLTTTGGMPGMLAMLLVSDVDGVPNFIELDLGTLDATGMRVFSAVVPEGCFSGLDVGFQTIAFESWSGQPVWSSVVRVTF